MSSEDAVGCRGMPHEDVWALVDASQAEEGWVHEGTFLPRKWLRVCFSSSCFSVCGLNGLGESIGTSQPMPLPRHLPRLFRSVKDGKCPLSPSSSYLMM